jgi:hypothetical protein
VVLRTASLAEHALKKYLSRLLITVESRAIGSLVARHGEGQPTQSTQANEVLQTVTVETTKDPLICAAEFQSENDADPVRFLYVFWKTVVPIGTYLSFALDLFARANFP